MPFDAAPEVNTKPSLAHLSHVLRHRELWPDGFTWYYGDCHNCAIGLAKKLYRDIPYEYGDRIDASAAAIFKMPVWMADAIFCELTLSVHGSYHDVTPEHVADAIDAHLLSIA